MKEIRPGKNLESETELIEAAKQGDLEAFNLLVLRYQDQVFQHALWIMKDHFQAEDVTQNTFIVAYLKIKQFRGGSFRAWLMRISSNTCYDELRRQKRRIVLPLSSEKTEDEQEIFRWLSESEPSVEQHVERNELSSFVMKCINELPALYRMPVLFTDLLEMNYEESAKALGIPLGTLKSRLSRARLMLQERLKASPVYHQETQRFLPAIHNKAHSASWLAQG
jgi:RNA polymerase sigma-70 factor, ECF subfamily